MGLGYASGTVLIWNHPWRVLADFVLGDLAPGLVAAFGDGANIRNQVTTNGQIFGELSVLPEAKQSVEETLHSLVQCFSVCRRHNLGY